MEARALVRGPSVRGLAALGALAVLALASGAGGAQAEGQRQRKLTYRLQASLKTLQKTFRPCGVSLDGHPLRNAAWDYDRKRGRVNAKFTGRKPRLVVKRRCG